MPRPRAKPPKLTDDQVRWVTLRDEVAKAIDLFVLTRPEPPMRRVVRALEDALAMGDTLSGCLDHNENGYHDD